MNRSKHSGMTIKAVVVLLVALALASVHLAEAQQAAKVPRIGHVSGTGSLSDPGPYVEALRQGLRDLGYIDGRNIVIEYRGAEGKLDRVPSIVNELVQLKVDVLIVPTSTAIRVAKQATKTIMGFLPIPPCLLRFIAGCPEVFLLLREMISAAPVLPVGYVVSASRIADCRMILAGYRLADLLIRLTQNFD